MKNKERLNLMLERLDRIDRILDEKFESSCKEGKSCEEDIDDLESMDEGVLDAVKGLVGNSGGLEAQSKQLAKDITKRLGTVTLSNGKNKALADLIEVTPRGTSSLRLHGMGCTVHAKNQEDNKNSVFIVTPPKDKSKSSYIFIGNDTHREKVDLKKPEKIADYIKKNLSNFTNIKTK